MQQSRVDEDDACSIEHARTVASAEMFDHVGIAVADLAASERFYRTVLSVLGAEPTHADAELVEWEDWAIGPTDREHPVTRGLHVGFRAPSREAVDAFWQAGIDAGYGDDGAPGPRTVYGPDYYGGFLLDPGGNSAEAVHTEREDPCPTSTSTTCESASATPPRPSASTGRSRRTPGCGSAWTSRTASRWSARTSASR
jgi:catechol 2,3-dioxygenase-like lactoylglutathione lyase family enzyme